MHSATKYLNGHSDMVGGMLVVGDNAELAEQLAFLQNSIGARAGAVRQLPRAARPEDAAPAHARALRERARAGAVAGNASGDRTRRSTRAWPRIRSTRWPSARWTASAASSRSSLKGGLDAAKRFCERTKLFTLAESLGGVESLVNHPAIMTHASIPPERRAQLGLFDNLVRLSVGVEDLEDLRRDLDHALQPKP